MRVRDKSFERKDESVQRPHYVFGRYGGNRLSTVSIEPGSETKSVVPGYLYAYDRRTRRYEPHRFIPVSTTYRVIAILISAVGVSIGVGIFLAECIGK